MVLLATKVDGSCNNGNEADQIQSLMMLGRQQRHFLIMLSDLECCTSSMILLGVWLSGKCATPSHVPGPYHDKIHLSRGSSEVAVFWHMAETLCTVNAVHLPLAADTGFGSLRPMGTWGAKSINPLHVACRHYYMRTA